MRDPFLFRNRILTSIAYTFTLIFLSVADAGQDAGEQNRVSVETVWSVDQAKPSETIILAVVLNVADGFHIGNSRENIQESELGIVMPTQVVLTLHGTETDLVAIGKADFPNGLDLASEGVKSKSSDLTGQAIIYLPVQIADAINSDSLRFDVSVEFQACDDKVCFEPQTLKQEISLPLADSESLRRGCPAPELFTRWNERREQKLSDRAKGVDYKSKEPPVGPPWVRDLAEAQRLALRSGRPIFLYSTKTFCPHCVVVESEVLSSEKLKPFYDRAIWLYVYRDFKGGEADRLAERVGIRYSLTSWPQLWLIDPHSLETIAEVGRSVEAFEKATSDIAIAATSDLSGMKELLDSEARVAEFEQNPTSSLAIRMLESTDVVSQLLAARYLTEQKQLKELTQRANGLLEIANDSLRYEVLNSIAATGDKTALAEVESLVKSPQPSRNFNVLRSHAIRALGACGNQASVSLIAPHAQGTARNMTTATAIDAMFEIAQRDPSSRADVIDHLSQSFPPVEAQLNRLVSSRAQKVHNHLKRLTGREVKFPETYTPATRTDLVKAWSEGN